MPEFIVQLVYSPIALAGHSEQTPVNKYFNGSPNVSKYLEWGMFYTLRSNFNMTVPEVIQLLLVEHNRRAIAQQINAKCNSYSESSTQTLSVERGDITISSIARSAFTLST